MDFVPRSTPWVDNADAVFAADANRWEDGIAEGVTKAEAAQTAAAAAQTSAAAAAGTAAAAQAAAAAAQAALSTVISAVLLESGEDPPVPPAPNTLYLRLLTADTTAPTVPTGLVSSAITSTGFTVSWTASSDAVGVTGYQVRVGAGTPVDKTVTSHSFTGLTASTAYAVTVRSRDAAGNWSAWSTALTVNTASAGASPLFADTFNRANGLAGNGWQGPSGDGSNTTIVSNALAFSGWSAYNRAWQSGLPRACSVRALFTSAIDTYQGIFVGYHGTTGGGVKLFNNGGTWVVGNADGFGTQNTPVTAPPGGSTALRLDLFADGIVRGYAGVGTADTLILDSTVTALGITGLSSDSSSVYRAGYCGEAKTPSVDNFEVYAA